MSHILGEDWEYFERVPTMDWDLVPQGDGTFELNFLQNPLSHFGVLNYRSSDGRDGFSTSDLIAPHPTKEGFYHLLGRKDDQILLSTGEKTHPTPMEASPVSCVKLASRLRLN